ncbi:MAG: sigma-70 family RNA polymerase sigma factor [Oscillospiraceae bacterium]|nr:sigma-70 family RNA polymerase sigma factor [Oscillospiraceae bacterium]
MDTISLKTSESFEQVMQSYMPMVYRIAFSRLGSAHDAEDITQDVFLKYYRADITYNDEEHRKAWLIRCTINCTKTLVTSAWFRHRASDEGLENMPEDSEILGSDGDIEKIDQRNSVLAAISKLPEKYRIVIHLFYYEDMSVSQISKATGIRESTVKSQLSRARDMLRPMLKEVDF